MTGSYIVRERQGRLQIIPTYYIPGFSPLHCETPEEAVEAAIEKERERVTEAMGRITVLESMLRKLVDQ